MANTKLKPVEPLSAVDKLLDELSHDGPLYFSKAQKILMYSIIENDRHVAIAYAVRRYTQAGHGHHKESNGAYTLAGIEMNCSPSTAERCYRNDVERAAAFEQKYLE